MERTRFMLIVLRFDTQISGVGFVVDLLLAGEITISFHALFGYNDRNRPRYTRTSLKGCLA